MTAIPDRHAWALDLLGIQSGDLVLEVGNGHGIATGLAAAAAAKVVAIDRSDKMAAACAKRNGAAVSAGRLEVLAGVLESAAFSKPFDKAVAVNVDFPLHPDRGWAAKFHAALKPGGLLVLVLEAPPGAPSSRFALAATQKLEVSGFIAEILAGQGAVGAVRARRIP